MESSGKKLTRLLVLSFACALLGANGASAGAEPEPPFAGLEELWRTYPLDPATTTPGTPVPAAPREESTPPSAPAEPVAPQPVAPQPVAPQPVAPEPPAQAPDPQAPSPQPSAADSSSDSLLYAILGVLGFALLFSALVAARMKLSGRAPKPRVPPQPPRERLSGMFAELSELDARVAALVAERRELEIFPSSWPRLPPFTPPVPPQTVVVEILRLASEREFDKVTTLSIRRSSSVSGNSDSEHKAPKVGDVATLVAAPLDPRKFDEVGSQVGGVLRAAGEAAEQIRADALQQAATLREQAQADAVRLRNEAEAHAKETRHAGETYAANHRREAEETVRRLIEESEAQARAVREAAEDMAKKIEDGARQHQIKVREEARSLEDRMQNSLEGLRDLASDLQELIQGKQKREGGTQKSEPGIDSLLESVRTENIS
jgi:hypothetical protein